MTLPTSSGFTRTSSIRPRRRSFSLTVTSSGCDDPPDQMLECIGEHLGLAGIRISNTGVSSLLCFLWSSLDGSRLGLGAFGLGCRFFGVAAEAALGSLPASARAALRKSVLLRFSGWGSTDGDASPENFCQSPVRLSKATTASVGCAPTSNVLGPLRVDLDEGGVILGVVLADFLNGTAIALGARVGDDNAVVRRPDLAESLQTNLDSHVVVTPVVVLRPGHVGRPRRVIPSHGRGSRWRMISVGLSRTV